MVDEKHRLILHLVKLDRFSWECHWQGGAYVGGESWSRTGPYADPGAALDAFRESITDQALKGYLVKTTIETPTEELDAWVEKTIAAADGGVNLEPEGA